MNDKHFFKRILMLFLSCLPLACSKENEKVQNHYFLYVDVVEAACDIKLNGASLVKEDRGGINTTTPINKWINSGENTLEIQLLPLDNQPSLQGKAHIQVYLHDNKEDFPTPLTIYTEINVSRDEVEGESRFQKVITFSISDNVASKSRTDMEQLEKLTDSDREEIAALIESFRTALVKGDYKKAVDLQKIKIEEQARMEGKSVEHVAGIVEENYQMLEKENITARAISADEISVEATNDGTMLRIFHQNGGEAIEMESETLSFEIPIFVSKINGDWHIVR